MLQCKQEISQECLLHYDQSQQRSRQVNWPQNHKLIKDSSVDVMSYKILST